MEPETYYAKFGEPSHCLSGDGRGPDLVMVPGLISHLETQWRDPGYRRFVRSLSSFCRLVRFDEPGTGPVRVLILFGTSPRRPPAWVMRQLRAMARR